MINANASDGARASDFDIETVYHYVDRTRRDRRTGIRETDVIIVSISGAKAPLPNATLRGTSSKRQALYVIDVRAFTAVARI